MAKRVIVLERLPSPGLKFRYALWAAVPTARQPHYADPTNTRVSAYKEASVDELTALRSGAVAETVDELGVPTGTSEGQIKTRLEAIWAVFQARVDGANDWSEYGTVLNDDGTWTDAGV